MDDTTFRRARHDLARQYRCARAFAVIALALCGRAAVAVRIDTNPAHRVASIVPQRAVMASVDSDPPGKYRCSTRRIEPA